MQEILKYNSSPKETKEKLMHTEGEGGAAHYTMLQPRLANGKRPWVMWGQLRS
jgi:hypothetical protein